MILWKIATLFTIIMASDSLFWKDNHIVVMLLKNNSPNVEGGCLDHFPNILRFAYENTRKLIIKSLKIC